MRKAIAEFKPLLAKALEHPTAFTYMLDSRWALFQGQPERALTQAQRAVDLAPYGVIALNDLAHALIFAGRPEDGLRRADEMRRLNPKGLGGAHRLRGLALFSLERYEEAAAAFEAYRAARPNSGSGTLFLTAILRSWTDRKRCRSSAINCSRGFRRSLAGCRKFPGSYCPIPMRSLRTGNVL